MSKAALMKKPYESPTLRFSEFELDYAILGLSTTGYQSQSDIEPFLDGGDL